MVMFIACIYMLRIATMTVVLWFN